MSRYRRVQTVLSPVAAALIAQALGASVCVSHAESIWVCDSAAQLGTINIATGAFSLMSTSHTDSGTLVMGDTRSGLDKKSRA